MRVRVKRDHRNQSKSHDTYTINSYWVKRDLDTIMEEFDWAADHRLQSRYFSPQRTVITKNQIADRLANFLTLKNEVAEQGFLSDHQLTIPEQLENILRELTEVYHYPLHELAQAENKLALNAYFHLAESENLFEHYEKVFSPRLQFLIKRYSYLKQLHHELQVQGVNAISHARKVEDVSSIKQGFDVGKKALDFIDDSWDALKNIVKGKIIDKIGPFLSSAVGFIIHLGEGLSAAKMAYKAYGDANTPQRKTKIAVGSLSFLFAGAGLGLSISWVLGLLGVGVSGFSVFPIIIPALLTGIYAMNVWSHAYAYHRAKEQTKQAKADFQNCLVHHQRCINAINVRLQQREQIVKDAYHEMAPIAKKMVEGAYVTPAERDLYENKLKQIKHCAQLDHRDYRKLAQHTVEIEKSRKLYVACKKARAEAGREVVYASIEVLANTLILAATVLSVGAVITAASLASLGVLPLALVGVGVIVGLGVKMVQALDERHQHVVTHRISKWVSKGWDLLKKPFIKSVKVPDMSMQVQAENALRASSLAAKRGSTGYCLAEWEKTQHLSAPKPTHAEEIKAIPEPTQAEEIKTIAVPDDVVPVAVPTPIVDELAMEQQAPTPAPSSGACC